MGKFIQNAIERPGRVRRYVLAKFGEKAFTKKGTIKSEYLSKAQVCARKNRELSLEKAIILAKRLRAYSKEKIAYS